MSHWNLCWKSNIDRNALREKRVEDYCYHVNGICFLWASPCSGGCSKLEDLTSYSSFCPRLRYATSEEFTSALPALNAGRDEFYKKCAASRLDPRWNHCDYGNNFGRVEDNSWNDLVLVCDSSATLGATSGQEQVQTTTSERVSAPAIAKSNQGQVRAKPTEAEFRTPLNGTDSGAEARAVAGGAGADGAAAAIGDPHLQNIHGERFDLMRPGKHVLIHIPRGGSVENTMFRVDAEASRLGDECTDMYFQEINITGQWVEARLAGGLRFEAQGGVDESPSWLQFGKVQVKVAHGRTRQGIQYLNFYVKHLGHVGFAVGGLLGEDDHGEAAMPSKECVHRMSLFSLPSAYFPSSLVSLPSREDI